jgi:hypothetical protein
VAVEPAPAQVPLAPVPEVDALAMASEMGAHGPSLESVIAGMLSDADPAATPEAPIAPPSSATETGLTMEADPATGVPLAFGAAEATVPPGPEPVLAPDSGIVDLLALASLGVPLEV